MDAVTTLQDTIAGAAETVGPSVVGLGRGEGERVRGEVQQPFAHRTSITDGRAR